MKSGVLSEINRVLTNAQLAAWGKALPCQPYPILQSELGDFATDLSIRLAGIHKQTIQSCVAKVFEGLERIPGVKVSESRGFLNFSLSTELPWEPPAVTLAALTIIVPPLWRELGEAAGVRFLCFVFERARLAAKAGVAGRILIAGAERVEINWSGFSDNEWYEISKKLFRQPVVEKLSVTDLLSRCKGVSDFELWSPAQFFPDTAISRTERDLAETGSVLKLIHRTLLFDFECEGCRELLSTLPSEEFFNFVAALTVPDHGRSINPSLYKYITIDSPRAFAKSLGARLNSVIAGLSLEGCELCLAADSRSDRILRLLKAFDAWRRYVATAGEIVQYCEYYRDLLSSLNRYLNDPRMRNELHTGADQVSRCILASAATILGLDIRPE